ncbi:MAG TPA: AmmeMemoRadiSam system protein A [Sedimentibacter sp.]|nr:AmmeMemoRadiSam system protein A [Sedimentibacter sp.]HOH69924.1 AmmeMemoRadiSam system protein A [Sedimentibacter sp.]HPW99793.1 AmmeMemoRadiSam system protein A [Sedimentibacter sp.]HQB62780.1 AmmeMemoRadiSam system protein A [Sedimentibacter sp.]
MAIVNSFIVPHPPLIIPEIGRGEERKIQKTIDAYHNIGKQISEIKPDTIIITTPHSIMYSDYIHISPGDEARGSFREFGHSNVSMEAEYDLELVKEISIEAEKEGISAGTLGEKSSSLDHGVMVPLYFVNKYYSDYKLVRISISGLPYLDHYKFGKCIKKAAEKSNKKIVFIGSGDLSHMLKDAGPYGYREEGPVFDREVTRAMKTGNFLEFLKFDGDFCESAAECGLRSFIIMAGATDGKKVSPELLSYEGPFGVGYAVAAFKVLGDDEGRRFEEIYLNSEMERIESLKREEDEYVRLARQTLESYVINRKKIKKPDNLSSELLKTKAGVFVSLKLDGSLRGCIGTTSSTTPSIADEIIQNAVSAATEDPRFPPVREDELKRLVYSVDVLGEAEKIKSIDELNPEIYGVIVSKGHRRGLLLPNLEGIDTAEKQVSIALRKAGIYPEEKYQLERFQVVRHK